MTHPRIKALDDQLVALLCRHDLPRSLNQILEQLTGHPGGDHTRHLTSPTVYPRLQSLARRGIVERTHPEWAPERVLYQPSPSARADHAELEDLVAALEADPPAP